MSLSVYFDDLIVTTVKQKKEIDELGLLSKFEYSTKVPIRGSDKKILYKCNVIFWWQIELKVKNSPAFITKLETCTGILWHIDSGELVDMHVRVKVWLSDFWCAE